MPYQWWINNYNTNAKSYKVMNNHCKIQPKKENKTFYD